MSYDATRRALDALTDHVGFERLVTVLLTRTGINLRPLGGSGDEGRDAVVGLYRAEDGEPLAVTISLEKNWRAKIRADLKRMRDAGHRPETVISVTNRPVGPQAQAELQAQVKKDYRLDLTIHEQRWLVVQLHRRDNLDLLAEYLHLAPPRPRFFLDQSEFERLLKDRGLLEAPFAGRREELDRIERLLADQGRTVIVEAHGGYGKTRLAVELARSGRSATPWFFVDYGLPFDASYLAEAEAGYDVTVLIDDAHRRTDLDQLLRALERRDPKPRLVCTVRPGHAPRVEMAFHGLALPHPARLSLGSLGRSALNAILSGPPFAIEREGMRSQIIFVSEGNIGVALIAGELAAAGHDPSDLSQAELFAQHVEFRLHGVGADSRETRELLAVVASVGSLDLSDAEDVAAALKILGGDPPQLRRRLDKLADLGVVEEAGRSYTIKPDIVREHLVRASFFPHAGTRLLRYQDVYDAFASHRLHALLEALGQAHVDTSPAAAETLAMVRRHLLTLLEQAVTAHELETVALRAEALGAGGGVVVCEFADAVLDRLDQLDDDAVDQVAVPLVEALAAAKLGRDQLPRAWRVLLRLATLVCGRGGTARAREAALNEIRGIYGFAPIAYSARDPYLLASIQRAVREQSQTWWADARGQPGAASVAAAVVGVAFTLQLERQHRAAANAMAINFLTRFVPAGAETEALLRLGVALLRESLFDLPPDEQLSALKDVNKLMQVADGYEGPLGARPTEALVELARTVLYDVEQWLAGRLDELPLPVAAAVLSSFRRRHRSGEDEAPQPQVTGDLRAYLELVDNSDPWPTRLDGDAEATEIRALGARYGDTLVQSADPIEVIQRWNGWIEACETLTASPANHRPLTAAFERVAQSSPELAIRLATHIIENELTIARFSDRILGALAQEQTNWPLIQRWAADPSPGVRRAAARAVNRAPADLARRLAPALSRDADVNVRDQLWGTLVYGDTPLAGWRLDLAFALTEASATPLDRLIRLLGELRRRADGAPTRLSAKQRQAARRIVLASAETDRLPYHHLVRLTLERVGRFGLDLVIPWLRARLEYVKNQAASGRYIHPLLDELEPLLRARRRQADAKHELGRLLDELEAGASGVYQLGLGEAAGWLDIDSREVTRRISEWAQAGEDKLRLAVAFLASASWPVFTQRAQALLDARPNDPQVRKALLGARDPFSSPGVIGNLELAYRSCAAEYRRWTRSRDPRLRALGQEAVAMYERLGDEEAEKERLEQEHA